MSGEWTITSTFGFGTNTRRKGPVSDVTKFFLHGYYLVDIDHEIEYWEGFLDRKNNPPPAEETVSTTEEEDDDWDFDDEDITVEQIEERISHWKQRRVNFLEAFEEQRPKIDYDDGS